MAIDSAGNRFNLMLSNSLLSKNGILSLSSLYEFPF